MSKKPKKSIEEAGQELNRFCSKEFRPYPRRILLDAQRLDVLIAANEDSENTPDGKPTTQRAYVVMAIDQDTRELISCVLTPNRDDHDARRRCLDRAIARTGRGRRARRKLPRA